MVICKVKLEGGNSKQSALGGADLRRVIWQGNQVIAKAGGIHCEAIASKLHAIAAVASKADDNGI